MPGSIRRSMPGFSVMNNEVPIKQRSCVDACFLRFDARILVRFPAASLMSQAMNPDKRRIRNESRSCNRNSRRTRLKKRDYLRFRIRQLKGCEVAMKAIVGGAIESDCDDYPRSIAVKRFGEGSDCTLFGEGRIQVFGPESLAFQLEIPRPVQLRR